MHRDAVRGRHGFVGVGPVLVLHGVHFEGTVKTDDTGEVRAGLEGVHDLVAGFGLLGSFLGAHAVEVDLADLDGAGSSVCDSDESLEGGSRFADEVTGLDAVDEDRGTGRDGLGNAAESQGVVVGAGGVGSNRSGREFVSESFGNFDNLETLLGTDFGFGDGALEALAVDRFDVASRFVGLAAGTCDGVNHRIQERVLGFGRDGFEEVGGLEEREPALTDEGGVGLAEVGIHDFLHEALGELLAVRLGDFLVEVDVERLGEEIGLDGDVAFLDLELDRAFLEAGDVTGDIDTGNVFAGITNHEFVFASVTLAFELVAEIALGTDGEIGSSFCAADEHQFGALVSNKVVSHDLCSPCCLTFVFG